MKKWGIGLLSLVLIAVLFYIVGTGFMERYDVMLSDFSVSQDGTELTLLVTVASSAGFIRDYQDVGGGVKPHLLRFYSTFGGVNSSFGAKNTFVLPVSDEDTEIYFSRPGKGYELVLEKNPESGVWQRPAVETVIQSETEEASQNDLVYRGEAKEIRDLLYRGETVTVLKLEEQTKP